MNKYDEIINKLNKLRRFDRNFTVFGSLKHQYRMNPTLKEKEIEQFETLNAIKLPYEYREFILRIGNGGAGPDYGILELGKLQNRNERLSAPFPLTKDFIFEEEEGCILDDMEGSCAKCNRRKKCLKSTYFKGEDRYESELEPYRFTNGTMAIVYSGCTYYSRIVLNGKHKGEIWAENVGNGLVFQFKSFLEYYENWLDSCLQFFESLMEGMALGRQFDELMAEKTPQMMSETEKAKAVAGLMGIPIYAVSNHVDGTKQVEIIKQRYKRYAVK